MLEVMRFGIVGAGPCGTFAALLLLEAGYEVHLFDIDNDSELANDKLKSNIKLMRGSTSPYDMNQFVTVSIDSSPATFYRSKLSGGFSNIWGATWGSVIEEDNQQLKKHYDLSTVRVFRSLGVSPDDGYTQGCSCFNFIDSAFMRTDFIHVLNLSRTQLAINSTFCTCVENGGTSCGHGSIWNSKSMLAECLKYKDFIFFKGVDVTTISIDDERPSVSYLGKREFYDGITIAAGPLGSSEILLNTFPSLENIDICDTLMGYMPFFKFKLNGGHSGAFAFSQFRFELRFGSANLCAHIQLYSHSEIYIDRILGKLPKFIHPLFKKFASSLLPHIGIALIYLDSEVSSSLSVSKGFGNRDLEIKINRPEKKAMGLRKSIWQAFRELNIFPLVALISWAKPGESYHLGAGGEELIDEFGFLNCDKRISVAGSLALPKINPGPITHAAMAQSSRLVEQIVHQNLESI